MDRLSSIVPTVLRKYGLHEDAGASQVLRRADEWIAKELPTQSGALKAKKMEGTTLLIEGQHSIAIAELSAKRDLLLEFLQRECQGTKIEKVLAIRNR